jgi:hypothetical protein
MINNCNKINNILINQYFVKLREHNDSNNYLQQFIKTQISFLDAVDNWSKALGNMIAKVPSYKERIILVKNLYDEHGNGNINNCHVNTFNRFIKSFNQHIDTSTIKIDSVKQFNSKINDMIENKSWIYSMAALGTIEYTYITISKEINNYAAKFMNQDKIEHYSMHEILDVQHATELFDAILPYFNEYQFDILAGMDYGYNVFNQLYSDLSTFLHTTTSE